MDLREAADVGEDGSRHWYYRNKVAAVSRLAGERDYRGILDIGAGSGIFSRALLAQRPSIAEATCLDPNYEREDSETVAGKTLRFVRETGPTGADLALLIDVLEHVDDPAGLLRQSAQLCADNATFVISVPAFQWLWSEHDDYLEHRRRYTANAIEAVVRAAGLEPVRTCYFFASVFPIAAATRLAARLRPRRSGEPQSQMRDHGALADKVLSTMLRAELPLFMHNRLFGLSVLCRAARPG